MTYCLTTSGRFFSPLGLCCAWGLMDVTLLITANTRAPLEEWARVGWGMGGALLRGKGRGFLLGPTLHQGVWGRRLPLRILCWELTPERLENGAVQTRRRGARIRLLQTPGVGRKG